MICFAVVLLVVLIFGAISLQAQKPSRYESERLLVWLNTFTDDQLLQMLAIDDDYWLEQHIFKVINSRRINTLN